jgi:hypothetical protein
MWDPQWSDVESALLALKDSDRPGCVQIDIDTDEPGPRMLQVFHEHGRFIAMLGEMYEDWNVRTFENANFAPDQLTTIFGNYWSKRSVTRDFKLVVQAFKEFVETGDVSRELMS